MDGDCTFCMLYEDGAAVVYEDDRFYAQFDPYPVTPGHAEVIPTRHVADLQGLDDAERAQLLDTVDAVWTMIQDTDLSGVYDTFLQDPLDDRSADMCRDALDAVLDGYATETPQDYNLGVNNGPAAGRTIDHLHVHIMPRWPDDPAPADGGVRHVHPEKGDYTA